MSYVLNPQRPVASEVRRVADKQLELAVASLHAATARSIDAATLHDARRHVKKIRALLRLVQPALGGRFRRCNRQLRKVSRLLSAVSDGEAVTEAVVRLAARRDADVCGRSLVALRKALVQRRRRIAEQARRAGDFRQAADRLARQRRRVAGWRLRAHAFDAVGPGLARRIRAARRAMTSAAADPSGDNFHRWRRRVKEHWLGMRLLDRRCGGALAEEIARLEALDGCLGEYHNTVLLQSMLCSDQLLPRQETAQVLRLLRRYQRELRREALQRGHELYAAEPTTHVIKRVRKAWRAAAAPAAAPRWTDAA